MTPTPCPRPEYPRPQFRRDDWINLNGPWAFALDDGAVADRFRATGRLDADRVILVPFCPESALSGIGHTDFIPSCWYARDISVPPAWAGRRTLLHFGAVDFHADVYLDGAPAGSHAGGSSPFAVDLTDRVVPGRRHTLAVHVRDDVRSGEQGLGKQCPTASSKTCYYTRVTGIWQTVWLEALDPAGLESVHLLPDLDGGRFTLIPRFHAERRGRVWRASLYAGEERVAQAQGAAVSGAALTLAPERARAWSPDDPFLYRLEYEVAEAGGEVVDRVHGYAGLRKIHVEGETLCLNNRPLRFRGVLDQGYHPDGLWTAPSDESLRRDIELAKALGFNGARLHQKFFEPRYHYWADRLGWLTWGEAPSWGLSLYHDGYWTPAERKKGNTDAGPLHFLREWGRIVERDRNHPSVIVWTPLNETDDARDWARHRRFHEDVYERTKRLDPTRPVNDASGYVHVRTDLYTVHCYAQDGEELRRTLSPGKDGAYWRSHAEHGVAPRGEPYLVDEFGGIVWAPPSRRAPSNDVWGYGAAPGTEEEFLDRLARLIRVLDGMPHVKGWCYTQLYDVEQEKNGLLFHDRTMKFDPERLRAALRGKSPRPLAVSPLAEDERG